MTGAKQVVMRYLPAEVQKHARSLIRGLRRRRFTQRIIVRRYGDFDVTICLVDQKSASWYDQERDFEPEIAALRRHRLKPGAIVFDLGAHQGVVATALAKLVAPDGRVVALEASPRDASAARRNVQLNSCTNLTVINAAVADRVGELQFESKGLVHSGNRGEPTVTVPARTIDDLAFEFGSPDVLFIDIDGYEVHALRGAQRVLSTRPDCYIEVHGPLLDRYGVRPQEVIDILHAHAYFLYVSSEMRPSRRVFRPWSEDAVDFSRPFHILALAHPLNPNSFETDVSSLRV